MTEICKLSTVTSW